METVTSILLVVCISLGVLLLFLVALGFSVFALAILLDKQNLIIKLFSIVCLAAGVIYVLVGIDNSNLQLIGIGFGILVLSSVPKAVKSLF